MANAAAKTRSQFKGMYKSLAIRRGRKRAIVAVGHKIIRIIYTILSNKVPYQDPNINHEELVVIRNAPRWIRSLQKFGYMQ